MLQPNPAVEHSKALNKENFILKQRINELETQHKNNIDNLQEKLQGNIYKLNMQAEQDQTTIEDSNITLENLQEINKDLQSQLSNMENLYENEKIVNKALQTRLQEVISSNKENSEMLKAQNTQQLQQMNHLYEEKYVLEKKNSTYETKIQGLEVQNGALGADLRLTQNEVERLRTKLREYEEIISILRKSIESFMQGKDGEIAQIKNFVVEIDEKLRKSTMDNALLLSHNKELSQSIARFNALKYEERIQALSIQIKEGENSRKGLQEQLKKSEERLKLVLEKQNTKEIEAVKQEYRNKYLNAKEEIKGLNEILQESADAFNKIKYENNSLKLQLSEVEELNTRHASLNENMQFIFEEHQRTTNEMDKTRKNLFSTCKELHEKNRANAEQAKHIKDLEQQVQTLEGSLSEAFEEIKKLHLALEDTKKVEEPAEPVDLPPARKDDEVDQKLREIMIKTRVPIKFIRVGEGLYIFGSKRVHVKILNGKLVIRIGGGYMYVEEFIKLYAHQELAKLKNTKDEVESEDTFTEGKSFHTEENIQGDCLVKELHRVKGKEIGVCANPNPNFEFTPIKRKNFDRHLLNTPEPVPVKTHTEHSKSISTTENITENVTNKDSNYYEITPRGGSVRTSVASSRNKTPDAKCEMNMSLRISEAEFGVASKRNSCKGNNADLHSAREVKSHSKRG